MATHIDKAADDKAQIAELILGWALARDQGRWDQLAATFVPGGHIAVSWFNGTHADFIEASRQRYGKGFSKHVMCGTVATVYGGRAYAETSVLLTSRSPLHGVDVAATSHFRFLDRLRRTGGGWKIAHRSAIYETDSITPDVPGEQIHFDMDTLLAIPRPYRFLAYRLGAMGLTVPADLPVAGSAAEEAIRADCIAWLAATGADD